MKDWKECPKCFGTGLVGGFAVRCSETRPAPPTGWRDEDGNLVVPAEIIRELLTNHEWGLGLDDEKVASE
jgi:hypothetical protein